MVLLPLRGKNGYGQRREHPMGWPAIRRNMRPIWMSDFVEEKLEGYLVGWAFSYTDTASLAAASTVLKTPTFA